MQIGAKEDKVYVKQKTKRDRPFMKSNDSYEKTNSWAVQRTKNFITAGRV